MYKTGDRVKHRLFGLGTVLEVMPDSVKIKFDILATSRNIRKDYKGISKAGENHMKDKTKNNEDAEIGFIDIRIGNGIEKVKSILKMFLSYAFDKMDMNKEEDFNHTCVTVIDLLYEQLETLEKDIGKVLLIVNETGIEKK